MNGSQKRLQKLRKRRKKLKTNPKGQKNISPSPEPFYGFTAPEIQRSASLYEAYDGLIPDRTIHGYPCVFCHEIDIKTKDLILHMQEIHSKQLNNEQKNLEVIFELFGMYF